VQVTTTATGVKNVILFQTRDPLLGKQKLREAIAHALDLRQIVPPCPAAWRKPNASVIHATSPYYDDAQRKGYKYDPATGPQAAAGSRLQGRDDQADHQQAAARPSFNIALMAQQMLQAVGINAEVEVLEWATQLDRYNKGNYQMMVFSYSARLDPALSYEQFSGPKDKQSRKVWDNPQALALIDPRAACRCAAGSSPPR
jgi:peptide/nickel transport system substrate-binding protein